MLLGVALLDDDLEFLAERPRPSTALAAAYDLKVFFGVVANAPGEVLSGRCVVGSITAHHSGLLQARLLRLSRYRLLVVDEVGYIPFEPEAANLFFQLDSLPLRTSLDDRDSNNRQIAQGRRDALPRLP